MTMNLHTPTTAPKAAQATSVSPLEQSGSSKTKFSRGKGKSKARSGAIKTDLYQTVTDSIISALESGVKPWVCPWVRNGAAAGLPANFSTDTAYSGINIMLLWCSAAKQGFQDARWLTYRQAQKAFYRPATDEIVLPERFRFADAANFYATGLHELVHWTGAASRLNREKGNKFGSEAYAFEELIAELGSAFLMADLGIAGEVQHESYIASWLKALKGDKRYIFKAAAAASKAHRWLMDC